MPWTTTQDTSIFDLVWTNLSEQITEASFFLAVISMYLLLWFVSWNSWYECYTMPCEKSDQHVEVMNQLMIGCVCDAVATLPRINEISKLALFLETHKGPVLYCWTSWLLHETFLRLVCNLKCKRTILILVCINRNHWQVTKIVPISKTGHTSKFPQYAPVLTGGLLNI